MVSEVVELGWVWAENDEYSSRKRLFTRKHFARGVVVGSAGLSVCTVYLYIELQLRDYNSDRISIRERQVGTDANYHDID